jgi:hypothetical protein
MERERGAEKRKIEERGIQKGGGEYVRNTKLSCQCNSCDIVVQ